MSGPISAIHQALCFMLLFLQNSLSEEFKPSLSLLSSLGNSLLGWSQFLGRNNFLGCSCLVAHFCGWLNFLNLWLYDAYQLKVEHQSRIRRNLTSTTLAISQLLRNVNFPLTAYRHHRQGFSPALDKTAGIKLVCLGTMMLGSGTQCRRAYDPHR